MKTVLALMTTILFMNFSMAATCLYQQEMVLAKELALLSNIFDDRKTVQLYEAIKECNIKKMSKAISGGADVNALNSIYNGQTDRYTPIIFAIKRNCPEAVQLLVDNNADVNLTRAIDGNSPLMIAIRQNKVDAALILLQSSNIDLNKESFVGRTAVIVAAMHGQTEIIAELLKNNSLDLSATNAFDSGATAIGVAARQNNLEALNLLVNHSDAIKPISSRQLKGAYTKAKANNHEEAIKLLDQYKERFYPELVL